MDKLALMVDDEYGQRVRCRFKNIRGDSALAMLASPSREELEQLKKAVAIMTPKEKESVDKLSDKQVQGIAEDAKIDCGIFAIFINGYILYPSG